MMRRKRGPMSQSQRRRVAVSAGCLPPAVYKTYIRYLSCCWSWEPQMRAAFPGVAACRNDVKSHEAIKLRLRSHNLEIVGMIATQPYCSQTY